MGPLRFGEFSVPGVDCKTSTSVSYPRVRGAGVNLKVACESESLASPRVIYVPERLVSEGCLSY